MEKEILILIGAIASITGAFGVYIAAKVTSSNQIKIAQINADKDSSIQERKITNERIREEVALERKRLEELHTILSKIALENSQTISVIQLNEEIQLSDFRKRYLENCDRLHVASAISALYYPEIVENIKNIYGQTNVFWGYQEKILELDYVENENHHVWQDSYQEVLKASQVISEEVNLLQNQIATRGRELHKLLSQN